MIITSRVSGWCTKPDHPMSRHRNQAVLDAAIRIHVLRGDQADGIWREGRAKTPERKARVQENVTHNQCVVVGAAMPRADWRLGVRRRSRWAPSRSVLDYACQHD